MVCGPSSPDQPPEAGGDLVERDIPRGPLEATAPFGSGSPLGMQDAIWAVDAVDVVVDLHAEPPPCEGLVGSPWTSTARPFSTVSIAQVSGQSRGQAPLTIVLPAVAGDVGSSFARARGGAAGADRRGRTRATSVPG